MNPNHSNWTGRMPRTLTDAFGTDAESACAVTCYRAPRAHKWVLWALIAVGIFAAWGLR